jgi:hypothetical protein
MQKKDILIYSNTGLTSIQIGLTAEVLALLNKEENNLKVVLCDNVLHNCFFNRSHNLLGCIACQSRLHKILDLVGIPAKNRIKLKVLPEQLDVAIPNFKNLSELLGYNYKGIDIGRGAASSIISYYRDYEISSEKYHDIISLELKKSILVVDFFEKFIKEEAVDEIYLFNGRFAEVRPLLKLAEKYNIPFYTIESGTINHFELYANSLPHSIVENTIQIHNYWEKADPVKRKEVAELFYTNRRTGNEHLGLSFTKKQQRDLLPKDFDKSKNNIAIFNSSEDEFKVLTEWQTDLYQDQNEAIFNLVEHFKNRIEYHFYLRIHPNLSAVENQQIRELKESKHTNLTVILPNDHVDSYGLVDACDKVITFGSTMGAEANYWGKPSILYGNSFYVNLNCTYVPKSFAELEALILDDNLASNDKLGSLKYGYYLSSYGTAPEIVEFKNGKVSKVKEVKLRTFYLNAFGIGIRYLGNIKQWFQSHYAYFGKKLGLKDFKKYM